MSMWVFRVSRGTNSGDPQGDSTVFIDTAQLDKELQQVKQTLLGEYPQTLVTRFLMGELFDSGRLRQGWSVPGLDLTLPTTTWVKNFYRECWKYWGAKATVAGMMGRKRILDHLTSMKIGDVVFIPNVGTRCIDEGSFAVATVKSLYRFEDRSEKPDNWEKDFAHIIGVERLETFAYSPATLPRTTFGAPFMKAIDPVHPHYGKHDKMRDFLAVYYTP